MIIFIGFMHNLDETSKAGILKFILLMKKVKPKEEIQRAIGKGG